VRSSNPHLQLFKCLFIKETEAWLHDSPRHFYHCWKRSVIHNTKRSLMWYHRFKCSCPNRGQKWWCKGQVLWRTRTGIE
jgi:hypothetical protein